MKLLTDIEHLQGVKVLARVDFNVPVVNGAVIDDFRIRKIMPTLTYLKEKGAKSILMSHIEDNADPKATPSLEPVVGHLKKLGIECVFVKNYRNAAAAVEALPEGGFVLLENLRMNEGEKKNDTKFAQELASLADVYVNEAFSVSHRAHASVVAVTKFLPSYAGFLFAEEIKRLSLAFHPDRPFFFILGGAKFETKLPLIEKFLTLADYVFVGGALANNFFKEKGYNLGKSLVSPENFNLGSLLANPKLLLPVDVTVIDASGSSVNKKPDSLAPEDNIMDVGPETVTMLEKIIAQGPSAGVARPVQIIWNGTLGAYEQGFKQPTLELAKAIAGATAGATTILGGGDTLASIAELNIESSFSFVSSGGGAMLDYLATETLPGLEALNNCTL